VFDEWWQFARGDYLGLDGEEDPKTVTLYYDPLLDVHHRLPARVGLNTSIYLATQTPEDARRIYFIAAAEAGLRHAEPRLPDPRYAAQGLLLAREWGDHDVAVRLAAAIEERYEPTWDTATGDFTWGCGLNEEYPRGQYVATLAAAEAASEGAWQRFGQRRFPDVPGLVRGVDFPAVGLSEARWADGTLHVQLSAQTPTVVGTRTSFEVVGLREPTTWQVSGPPGTTSEVSPQGALRVTTTVGTVPLTISR
jgi:hypothetical protein